MTSQDTSWQEWARDTAARGRLAEQRIQALQDLGVQLSTTSLRIIDRMDAFESRMYQVEQTLIGISADVAFIKAHIMKENGEPQPQTLLGNSPPTLNVVTSGPWSACQPAGGVFRTPPLIRRQPDTLPHRRGQASPRWCSESLR